MQAVVLLQVRWVSVWRRAYFPSLLRSPLYVQSKGAPGTLGEALCISASDLEHEKFRQVSSDGPLPSSQLPFSVLLLPQNTVLLNSHRHHPCTLLCTSLQSWDHSCRITHTVNWPQLLLNCTSDVDCFRIKSVPVGFLCWVVRFKAKSPP